MNAESKLFANRMMAARKDAERFKDLIPEVIELPLEDYVTFLDALANPKPPTAALIKLMRGAALPSHKDNTP